MTRYFKSSALVFFFGMMACALMTCVLPARAQEPVKIPPRSEYQYKKDYAEVNEIMKEADVAKREAMLNGFVKEHPESRMIPYVAAQLIQPYAQKQDWQKVISLATDFQKLIPDDPGLDKYLLGAYFRTNNFAKAGEIADKMYKANPTKETAAEMAGLYQQMKNTDKYLFYAEKAAAEYPIEQSYAMMLQIAQIYLQRQDVPKALGYLSKIMDAYGGQTPPKVQEAEWNKTRAFAYGLMAADAYGKKDCAKSSEYYNKVATFAPKTAEAHYYVGMCRWKEGDQVGAIPYFARAAVLNQNISPKAQEYLEQLYKAEHNGSLDGMDEVLAKAKSEVGVS